MLDSSVFMKDITARVERDQVLCRERKALQESKVKPENLIIIDSLSKTNVRNQATLYKNLMNNKK